MSPPPQPWREIDDWMVCIEYSRHPHRSWIDEHLNCSILRKQFVIAGDGRVGISRNSRLICEQSIVRVHRSIQYPLSYK